MGHDNKPHSALRIERFLQGVTLRDLEQATGRSRMFFSRLETGGPATLTPDLARKIADTLGVPPEKIFNDTPEANR